MNPNPMAIESLLNPGEQQAQHSSLAPAKTDIRLPRVSPFMRTSASAPIASPQPTMPWPNAQALIQSPPRRKRREFRHPYQQEEVHFIWYHRVDLAMEWPELREAYTRQFPDRRRNGYQGMQCKYYRCTDASGIPKSRERNRSSQTAKLYGLRAKRPDLWYDWMRESRPTLPLPWHSHPATHF
jgi:hypothetical protein